MTILFSVSLMIPLFAVLIAIVSSEELRSQGYDHGGPEHGRTFGEDEQTSNFDSSDENNNAHLGSSDGTEQSSSFGIQDFHESENDDESDSNVWPDTIPGNAGKDYPNYDRIPETSFSCNGKTPGGYYADTETRCQVFHVCNIGGMKSSFLCPQGSVFNQKYFVCDWWYDFECGDAADLYSLNEEINRGGTGSGPSGPGPDEPQSYEENGYPSHTNEFSTATYQEGLNSLSDGYDLSLAGTGEGGPGYAKDGKNRGYQSNVNDQNRNEEQRGGNNNQNRDFKQNQDQNGQKKTGAYKGRSTKEGGEQSRRGQTSSNDLPISRDAQTQGSGGKNQNFDGNSRRKFDADDGKTSFFDNSYIPPMSMQKVTDNTPRGFSSDQDRSGGPVRQKGQDSRHHKNKGGENPSQHGFSNSDSNGGLNPNRGDGNSYGVAGNNDRRTNGNTNDGGNANNRDHFQSNQSNLYKDGQTNAREQNFDSQKQSKGRNPSEEHSGYPVESSENQNSRKQNGIRNQNEPVGPSGDNLSNRRQQHQNSDEDFSSGPGGSSSAPKQHEQQRATGGFQRGFGNGYPSPGRNRELPGSNAIAGTLAPSLPSDGQNAYSTAGRNSNAEYSSQAGGMPNRPGAIDRKAGESSLSGTSRPEIRGMSDSQGGQNGYPSRKDGLLGGHGSTFMSSRKPSGTRAPGQITSISTENSNHATTDLESDVHKSKGFGERHGYNGGENNFSSDHNYNGEDLRGKQGSGYPSGPNSSGEDSHGNQRSESRSGYKSETGANERQGSSYSAGQNSDDTGANERQGSGYSAGQNTLGEGYNTRQGSGYPSGPNSDRQAVHGRRVSSGQGNFGSRRQNGNRQSNQNVQNSNFREESLRLRPVKGEHGDQQQPSQSGLEPNGAQGTGNTNGVRRSGGGNDQYLPPADPGTGKDMISNRKENNSFATGPTYQEKRYLPIL